MSRKKHRPSKRVSVYVPDKDFNYVDPFDSGVCEECKWRTGGLEILDTLLNFVYYCTLCLIFL